MRKVARAFILALAFAQAGCASSDIIELSAAHDQQSITRDGTPSLFSVKQHVVMLRPVSKTVDSSGRPEFVVAMKNVSSQNVDFVEAGTSARLTSTGQPIRVYRYAELIQEEKQRQRTQAVLAGLAAVGGAMNAANSGYSTTTGSYSGYNSYGNRSYGTFQARTYDPNRAILAQQLNTAQTQINFDRIRSQGESNMAQLEGTILKDQTVFPDEWHGGIIVLDKPVKNDLGRTSYIITVQFAGDVHEFEVSQSKAQQ